MQADLDPKRADDPHALPDLEVFWLESGEERDDETGLYKEEGWYFWFCLPGCLPDSEAWGPYATKAKALEAARDEFVEEEEE